MASPPPPYNTAIMEDPSSYGLPKAGGAANSSFIRVAASAILAIIILVHFVSGDGNPSWSTYYAIAWIYGILCALSMFKRKDGRSDMITGSWNWYYAALTGVITNAMVLILVHHSVYDKTSNYYAGENNDIRFPIIEALVGILYSVDACLELSMMASVAFTRKLMFVATVNGGESFAAWSTISSRAR